MNNHELFARKPRFLIEEGRQQTDEDVALPHWSEHRYVQERWAGQVRFWRPSAKSKSFEAGAVFCFRLCPAIPTFTQKEIDRMDIDRIPRFLPGRDESGLFTEGTLRCVHTIDNFGFDRKVSFIPSLPYVPPNNSYEKYASPSGNPYSILTTTLWRKRESLPRAWGPLVMKVEEINAYRKSHGLYRRTRSQLLLPLPKKRYFGYGLIYRGYNIETEEDFAFEDRPYGLQPEHGLQLVTFNGQAAGEILSALMLPSRPGARDFYYPDPAAPDAGTLMYVWNRECSNPVIPKAAKLTGFGYAGAVETRYFQSPTKPVDVDLTLPESFLEFYSENRQPWSSVLRGTYGTEQVRMIAGIAPELKGPCKLAWQNHPLLMEAWEEAFQGVSDEECDFFEVLHRIYGNEEPAGESNRFQGRPSLGSNEFTESEAPANEPETPDLPAEPVTTPPLQTRGRIDRPDPETVRTRSSQVSVPTGPKPAPPLRSPLRAVGALFDTPSRADFEIGEPGQNE